MAAPAQVTWAKFDSRGENVLLIGGRRRSFFGSSDWQLSAEEAVALIEQDEWHFFVEIDDEREWLEVSEEPDGSKTLAAEGPILALS